MKYKLLIFDLDGTILDTLDDLTSSVNFALDKNSLPLRTRDEIRSFLGNGIRLLIERSVPADCNSVIIDKVFNDFKKHYSLHSCDNTKPYDGIIEMIEALKKFGFFTAVISNKADFAVKDLVEQYFDGLFDYYVGERDGIPKKPSPDSVKEAMTYFNIDKEETIYIGDSEVDVLTARNAETDLICVDWGFRSRHELSVAGARIIVSEVTELMNCILDA